MGYTNRRAIKKFWDLHTKTLNTAHLQFYVHNNKFRKGWSPSSELMTGKNVPTLTTIINDLSDTPFIENDIFEVTVKFSPRGTLIGTIDEYFEHQNMSYIFQSTNNRPLKHDLTAKNRTNVWVLSIGIK